MTDPRLLPKFKDLLEPPFSTSDDGYPCETWRGEDGKWCLLEFMVHDYGVCPILSVQWCGEKVSGINLGTYVSMEEINLLVKALKIGEYRKLPILKTIKKGV